MSTSQKVSPAQREAETETNQVTESVAEAVTETAAESLAEQVRDQVTEQAEVQAQPQLAQDATQADALAGESAQHTESTAAAELSESQSESQSESKSDSHTDSHTDSSNESRVKTESQSDSHTDSANESMVKTESQVEVVPTSAQPSSKTESQVEAELTSPQPSKKLQSSKSPKAQKQPGDFGYYKPVKKVAEPPNHTAGTWFSKLLAQPHLGWTLVATLLVVAIYLLSPTSHSLLSPDEARYVGISGTAAQTGQLLIPQINGVPFFHKPPLFYWLTSFGVATIGYNEIGWRFASILAGLVLLFSWRSFLSNYFNRNFAVTAWWAIAFSMWHWIGAQYANTDQLVASCIGVTILSGVAVAQKLKYKLPHKGSLFLMYAFAVLGFWAKGLIGIVLPGAVILLYLVFTGKLKFFFKFLPWKNIVAALAVGIFPLVLIEARYPGYLYYFIFEQQVLRFLSEGEFNNVNPWWFYIPLLLVSALPWLYLVIRNSRRFVANLGTEVATKLEKTTPAYQAKADANNATTLLSVGELATLTIIWVLLITVFFSVPHSKLIGYIFPVVTPLTVLLLLAVFRIYKATHVDFAELLYNPKAVFKHALAAAGIFFVIVYGYLFFFSGNKLIKTTIDLKAQLIPGLQPERPQQTDAEPVINQDGTVHTADGIVDPTNAGFTIVKAKPTQQVYAGDAFTLANKDPNKVTIYSLGQFPYAFAMLYDYHVPLKIVLDTSDERVVSQDHWPYEILEGLRWVPALADKVLIQPKNFYFQLCHYGSELARKVHAGEDVYVLLNREVFAPRPVRKFLSQEQAAGFGQEGVIKQLLSHQANFANKNFKLYHLTPAFLLNLQNQALCAPYLGYAKPAVEVNTGSLDLVKQEQAVEAKQAQPAENDKPADKPAEEPVQPADNKDQPVEQPAPAEKPAEQPAQPSDNKDQPTEQPAPAEKPAEQPAPTQPADKPAEDKPAEGKPTEAKPS